MRYWLLDCSCITLDVRLLPVWSKGGRQVEHIRLGGSSYWQPQILAVVQL